LISPRARPVSPLGKKRTIRRSKTPRKKGQYSVLAWTTTLRRRKAEAPTAGPRKEAAPPQNGGEDGLRRPGPEEVVGKHGALERPLEEASEARKPSRDHEGQKQVAEAIDTYGLSTGAVVPQGAEGVTEGGALESGEEDHRQGEDQENQVVEGQAFPKESRGP
jgi:hypothetical protein